METSALDSLCSNYAWAKKIQCLTLAFVFVAKCVMAFFSLCVCRRPGIVGAQPCVHTFGLVGGFNLNLWPKQTKTMLIDFGTENICIFNYILHLLNFPPIASTKTIPTQKGRKNDTKEF